MEFQESNKVDAFGQVGDLPRAATCILYAIWLFGASISKKMTDFGL